MMNNKKKEFACSGCSNFILDIVSNGDPINNLSNLKYSGKIYCKKFGKVFNEFNDKKFKITLDFMKFIDGICDKCFCD